MKRTKKVLSILLSLAMLCSAALPTAFAADSRYGDTADHWAEASINRWSEYGVIEGYGDLFNPDNAITRAQMATILSKTLGLTETTENPFSDVSADSWYTPYILRCYKAGIMLGDNGMANPENEITRQEAMTMFCRAFGIKADETANLTAFKDSESVADWALPYVAALINNGIVNGVTSDTIAPADNMSRAALVTILDRAIGQYINTSGEYDLTDKDGIILVTAGDTTLKGETSADILITEAVGEKSVTFKDATVTGAVTVQADTKILNNNSKLPEIDATVEEITVAEDKTTPTKRPSGGSSGGSSGSSRPTVSDLTISEEKSITSGTYKNVTITDAVADGEVTLSNVTIQGDLTIKGGGSSSIKLDGCTVDGKVVMAKEGGQAPRLELTNTPIASVEVQKPAIIEAVDNTSAITSIETTAATEIRGTNTTVATLTVPETAESAVSVTVSAGNVAKVEAKAETIVTGESNTVGTVIATATVTADSGAVQKVEIPETETENVSVTVTGSENVEVEVNTANGAVVSGTNITVSTALETAPKNVTVGGKAVTHIHKWGEPEIIPETCEAEGFKRYVCVADGCGDNAEIKIETIKALGHSYGEWKDSKDGEHIRECARDNTHIEKAAHTWDEGKITKEPTCGEDGVKTYTCTACGATETDSVPMTEHIWGEWVKVDNDEHKRVCKNNAEHIEEAAHTPIIDTGIDATCTEAGKTDGSHCDICNSVIVEQTTIEPLGHDLTDLEVDETSHWYICTRENCGETTAKEAHTYNTTNCAEVATCTICNYEKAAGEHTWGAWVKADEDNHKHTCSSCNEDETAVHTWNEGEITTEPTEDAEGVKTYTCAECGAKKTESVPVVGANYKFTQSASGYLSLTLVDDTVLGTDERYYVTSEIEQTIYLSNEWDVFYPINGVTENTTLSYKVERGTYYDRTELCNLENVIDIVIDGAAPTVTVTGQADGTYLISPAPSAGSGYFYYLKNSNGEMVEKGYTHTGIAKISPKDGDVLTVQNVKVVLSADAKSVDITLSPVATIDNITHYEAPSSNGKFTQSESGYVYLNWTDDEELPTNNFYYVTVTSSTGTFSSSEKQWSIMGTISGITENTKLSYKIEKGTYNERTELYNFENVVDVVVEGTAPSVTVVGQADGTYIISSASGSNSGYLYHLKNADEKTIVKGYTATGIVKMSPTAEDTLYVQSINAEIAADAMSVDITLSPMATVDSITYCEAPTTTTEVDTLDELVSALNKGGNIQLTADVTTEEMIYISTGPEARLNLNGYKIDTPEFEVSCGKHIIIDGTTTGSSIYYSKGENMIDVNRYASIDINGGEYESILIYNSDKVSINNITATAENDTVSFNRVSTVYVTNSTITSVNGNAINLGECTMAVFDFDPTQYVNTSSYTVTDNGDGTYTVTIKE